jgi:hypothetical protein
MISTFGDGKSSTGTAFGNEKTTHAGVGAGVCVSVGMGVFVGVGLVGVALVSAVGLFTNGAEVGVLKGWACMHPEITSKMLATQNNSTPFHIICMRIIFIPTASLITQP